MPQTYFADHVDIVRVRSGDYLERKFLPNVDFSGRLGRMDVRATLGGPIVLSFTTALSTMVIAPTMITIIATAVATAAIKPGNYVYKMQVYTDTLDVQTIMEGGFEVF